jgi:hypothetical protein
VKLTRVGWFVVVVLVCWGARMVVEYERLERVIDTGHTGADRAFDNISFFICVVVTVVMAVWTWSGRNPKAEIRKPKADGRGE